MAALSTDALLPILGAGLESFLVEYGYARAEEAQYSRKLHTDNEQKKSAASGPKFWNRKFLREGIFEILTSGLTA